uniref:NR LBD domain-containing protein n=1 Tax=Caenorhabditis tropicalis TaxID=1561998 RepID=A0A1I7U4U0_9PELO
MLSDKNPKKTVVDLHRLLGEASKILNLGPATPLFCEGSQLKKLSLGVKNPFYLEKLKEAKMMTKAEIVANWEFYMKLLQTIWHVWSRLEKLSTTAKYRRCAESYKKSEIVVQSGVLVNISNVDFDSKWLSDHPPETVRNFMIHASCDQFDVTDALCELELSEVELTYMLAQLCFSYAGKRLQGEYLDVCEKFLEILSDDLHDFYVNEMNMPRYFGRMAKMMQINNAIQKCAKTPNMSTEIESSPRIYEKTKKRKGSKSASSIQKDASNLKMRQ